MPVHRQAVAISEAIGRPVKVICLGEDDIAQDAQRPPIWAEYIASLTSDGLPDALFTHFVGEEKNVSFSTRGVADMPYLIPNKRHEYSAVHRISRLVITGRQVQIQMLLLLSRWLMN